MKNLEDRWDNIQVDWVIPNGFKAQWILFYCRYVINTNLITTGNKQATTYAYFKIYA